MQRELETLRADVKGERQAREESAANKDGEGECGGQEKDLLREISQLHDEIGLERRKCEAAQEQVSLLNKQLSLLEKDKTVLTEQLQARAAELRTASSEFKHLQQQHEIKLNEVDAAKKQVDQETDVAMR